MLQPLQMIIPQEMFGVFFFLWLNGQAFSTVSILGIIVASGMDAAAAILMLEEIGRLREEGMSRDDAPAAHFDDQLHHYSHHDSRGVLSGAGHRRLRATGLRRDRGSALRHRAESRAVISSVIKPLLSPNSTDPRIG